MVSGSSDRTNPSGSLRGRQLGKVVEADISVLRQTLLVLQEGALPDWLSPVITTVSMSANASRTSRPSERGWYAVRMQNQIAAFRQTFRFEKGADVEAAVGQLHPTDHEADSALLTPVHFEVRAIAISSGPCVWLRTDSGPEECIHEGRRAAERNHSGSQLDSRLKEALRELSKFHSEETDEEGTSRTKSDPEGSLNFVSEKIRLVVGASQPFGSSQTPFHGVDGDQGTMARGSLQPRTRRGPYFRHFRSSGLKASERTW